MELRGYQREALDTLVPAERAIYADDMGTGKTPTSCVWLDEVDANRALIVSPRGRILQQWERELGTWHSAMTPVDGRGTPAKRAKAREKVVDWDRCGFSRTALLLGSYEGMRGDVHHLIDTQFDTLVFDESHHLKNRQTATFKAAAKLARRARRVLLVTGTPILNDAEECWSALHLMAPREYPSFWAWARRHFELEQTTFHGKLRQPVTLVRAMKPGHDELLREQLRSVLVQRPIDQLLPDLPPVEHDTIEVELTDDERTAYDTMSRKFWAAVDGDILYAANEVAKMTRLRQISSDWSAFAEGAPGTKVLACQDWLEHGEKTLVLVSFKQTANTLRDLLGRDRAVTYTGDEKDREREAAVEEFQRPGGPQVLIGTHGVVGEGVDGLQSASRIAFIDRDWTPARNDQAIARLRRSGQLSTVRATHFVARDTIDQDVSDALARKQGVIDSLLAVTPAT